MKRDTILILFALAFLYFAATERRRREDAALKLLRENMPEEEDVDADDDSDDGSEPDWDAVAEMLEADPYLLNEYNLQRRPENFLEWVALEHPEAIKRYADLIS